MKNKAIFRETPNKWHRIARQTAHLSGSGEKVQTPFISLPNEKTSARGRAEVKEFVLAPVALVAAAASAEPRESQQGKGRRGGLRGGVLDVQFRDIGRINHSPRITCFDDIILGIKRDGILG